MSAQIDFDGWRKPAQVESVRARHEKRGFGQIHFARDVLYPLRVARLWKDAHGGGIAAEGLGGEGVNVDDRQRHAVHDTFRIVYLQ